MRTVFTIFCGALLLCGLSQRASAQTDFRPGYVLPLSGDTLRGEVDLRDGRTSAQRCRFRPSAQAAVVSYTPADLRAYGFTARQLHYRSFSVGVEDEPARPRFLEVLADGAATLYFLRDEAGREVYYVASPSLPLAQLRHSYERVQNDAHVYAEEQTPFRNTLAKALVGCAPAMTRLPRLPYTESALRGVVAQYNNCQAAPVASAADAASATRVVFGLVAGVAYQRLRYSGFPYETAAPVASHTGIVLGPTLRISSRRLSEKVSLVVSLLYEPEKFEVQGYGYYGTPYTTYFDLAYLRAPVLLRYTFPKGRVAPLFEVGIGAAYALKTTNSYTYTTSNGGATTFQQILLPGDSFRKVQFAVGAGAGLNFRRANGRSTALLLRTELDNGFSGVDGATANVLHLYGMVSFDLSK